MKRFAGALLLVTLSLGALACKSTEKTEKKSEAPKTEAKTEEAKTEEAKTEEPKGPQPTRVD